LAPKEVTGERVKYRFWEVLDEKGHGQRLMICAFRHDKGTDVTIAMGDDVVMDALGASESQAATAVDKIKEILSMPKPEAPAIKP